MVCRFPFCIPYSLRSGTGSRNWEWKCFMVSLRLKPYSCENLRHVIDERGRKDASSSLTENEHSRCSTPVVDGLISTVFAIVGPSVVDLAWLSLVECGRPSGGNSSFGSVCVAASFMVTHLTSPFAHSPSSSSSHSQSSPTVSPLAGLPLYFDLLSAVYGRECENDK